MAESQATQQATQQPAPSPPEPPAAVKKTPASADNTVARDRDAQARAHAKVQERNPFSPENAKRRRESLMQQLRQERGVAEPRPPKGNVAGERDAAGGASESAGESAERVAPGQVAERSEAPSQQPPPSDAQTKWYEREQAVRAAESKVQEAQTGAERRIAEAEKREAEADAKLQRIEWAKNSPVEFLQETGMTEDEWQAFLVNGGKLSPEQKRVREMERQLAETSAKMAELEQRSKAQQQQAHAHFEEQQFAPELSNLTYVPMMGGMQAVRARQALLQQKTGNAVSLSDSAKNLEQELSEGMQRILQNKRIRSSLGLDDVNTSTAGQAATKPRTLSNNIASATPDAAEKIHPLDWKAKRRLYQERVERERSSN